jgi:cation:H+ antiporter
MPWLIFLISSAVIVLAAIWMAKYGDVIAVRTGLGGMFIGLVLLAAATSLPELLTSIVAMREGLPNLAAGNLLGSNMMNMFLLVVLDLIFFRRRILRGALFKHALSGSLAVLLMGLTIFALLAKLDFHIGWVGLDSVVILLAYLGSIRLIQTDLSFEKSEDDQAKETIPEGTPSMRTAVIWFAGCTGLLILATPYLVRSSNEIATITGLGTTFVGTTLVALITSLPELVTTVAAARLGAVDMAIGNLFGSNMFNIFVLGLSDLFFTRGPFLPAIDPVFVMVATLGMIMTCLALIGNLARIKRRLFFIEFDALLIAVIYFGGLYYLYLQGVGN